MLINILNLSGSVSVLQFNQIFIWQKTPTRTLSYFVTLLPRDGIFFLLKTIIKMVEDKMKIVDYVFLFSIMLRIIISGGEELYSVMCEDYCVIFNTWEGGYYGFIK